MNQKGYTLLPTLIIGSIVTVIVLGLLQFSTYDLTRTTSDTRQLQSVYIAQAGMEEAMAVISSRGWTGLQTLCQSAQTESLETGQFQLRCSTPANPSEHLTVTSTGTAGKTKTDLQMTVRPAGIDTAFVQRNHLTLVLHAGDNVDGIILSAGPVQISNGVNVSSVYSGKQITIQSNGNKSSRTSLYPNQMIKVPAVDLNTLPTKSSSSSEGKVIVLNGDQTWGGHNVDKGKKAEDSSPFPTIDEPTIVIIRGSLDVQDNIKIALKKNTHAKLAVIVTGNVTFHGNADVDGYYYVAGTLFTEHNLRVDGMLHVGDLNRSTKGNIHLSADVSLFPSSYPFLPSPGVIIEDIRRE